LAVGTPNLRVRLAERAILALSMTYPEQVPMTTTLGPAAGFGQGGQDRTGPAGAGRALAGPDEAKCGLLALVGGSEWTPGCESFDIELLRAADTGEVLVLPTAAAYWHPERAVERAREHFAALGASVKGCMVLRRSDAEERANVASVAAARLVYLAGGSVLHLRSVLKASPVWDALVGAWTEGAVVAGSAAGAMVLGETMVDPRGGALTLGLGLLPQVAVLPHASTWSEEKTHRTVRLASGGLRIAAIDERTALLRDGEGRWRMAGEGGATIWLEGQRVGLGALDQLTAPDAPATGSRLGDNPPPGTSPSD